MMLRRLIPIARLALVLVLSLAFAGTGFAHRAPVSSPDDGLAAYLAAGGSLLDLCGGAGDVGGQAKNCAACTLAKAMSLPAVAAQVAVPGQTRLQRLRLPGALPALGHVADPCRPARAPPLVRVALPI